MPGSDRSWTAPRHSSFITHHSSLLVLLLITIVGGVLRFTKLDQPAIWGDEAATYARINGSYQNLLDVLQYNGFTPLHYELYWWIAQGMPLRFEITTGPTTPIDGFPRMGRMFRNRDNAKSPGPTPATKRFLAGKSPIVDGGIRMTPVMMRVVPAIAGTLMIPAMYFLARQVAGRRVALLSALVTAFSAYLMVYSRDAKMYMHFWLMCTLSVACFLWWLRLRTRIPWLCWVASSIAMVGFHAPGLIILGLELVYFVVRDRQWWFLGLCTLVAAVGFGMVGGETMMFGWKYPRSYNAIAVFLVLGILGYIAQRTIRPTQIAWFSLGAALILAGPVVYYSSFSKFDNRINEDGWGATGIHWVAPYNAERDGPDLLAFTATAFLYSWEWATPKDERAIQTFTLRLMHGFAYGLAAIAVVGLVPWGVLTWLRRRPPPAEPAGLLEPEFSLLVVLTWIIVPTYAFYCVSVKGFWGPVEWWNDLAALAHERPWVMIGAAAVLLLAAASVGATFQNRARSMAVSVATAILLIGLVGVTQLVAQRLGLLARESGKSWGSVWMPRYLGVIWPAVAIAFAFLLSRVPTRPLRYTAVAFFIGANVYQLHGRITASEPPTDRMTADVLASQPASATVRAYCNVSHEMGVAPGQGAMKSNAWDYYMSVGSGIPMTYWDMIYRFSMRQDRFRYWSNTNAQFIVSDVKKNPQLARIVVWDKINRYGQDYNRNDRLKSQLGGDWVRVDEAVFEIRDHWTWMDMFKARRREYVRIASSPPPATTAPSTQPATQPSAPMP